MVNKELFILLCFLSFIISIKSQNSEDLRYVCTIKIKNNESNYKSINCDPIYDIFINQGEDYLCIYLDNQNGQYINSSIEVEGVKSIGLVNIFIIC